MCDANLSWYLSHLTHISWSPQVARGSIHVGVNGFSGPALKFCLWKLSIALSMSKRVLMCLLYYCTCISWMHGYLDILEWQTYLSWTRECKCFSSIKSIFYISAIWSAPVNPISSESLYITSLFRECFVSRPDRLRCVSSDAAVSMELKICKQKGLCAYYILHS